ncbi:guanyl-nucleotide exchange factor [Trichoderma citrinoviride]|uniref:Guanyl-nucleotide exchange factor n=1 Tax=Trichoderma citrinoviride TaxID=58853 RepID=A0A2T4BLY5_9HYPO|nr:guanyl-nucleotide exchange factor [Trichoderma citrinoviride]PTB70323.1 guanyl-nucleotide exchange factor [Trichoderma citrinoviride]
MEQSTNSLFHSFIHVAGWSQHFPSSARSLSHLRSISTVPSSVDDSSSYRPRPPPKSPSVSNLPIISFASKAASYFPSHEMSTLPDPRIRTASSSGNGQRPSTAHPDLDRNDGDGASTVSQHPGLSDEVATLSTKLINAINHQTALDDTLSATRHELETSHDRIRDLEAQLAAQREMMAGDVWIRRSTLENERKVWQAEKKAMQQKLNEETTSRIETEKEKRKIEQELENLTTALFEEANKMVIAAKEDAQFQHDVLTKKNDQLKAQLADSESLLKSQQEQLSELKQVLETMVMERDDQGNNTVPSTPGLEPKDEAHSVPEKPTPAPSRHNAESQSTPAPPTSFTHLIQPVLRTDIAEYDDFIALARLSHPRSGSRVSAGSSIGGFIGLGGSTSSAHLSNASTSSLSAFSNLNQSSNSSTPQSPNANANASATSAASTPSPIPQLKETRFFKRVLTEDVEPTLRLDAAPGLSWLARRTVLSAVADGSLVVEPIPAPPTTPSFLPVPKPQFYPCALCGESRKDAEYLRNYRFRTSEADSAQRYPLCGYCTVRVRSTCQFLGFLRMVKDGYWRADDAENEKAAWEESVRLREQMFWARLGGGVVPVSHGETHTHSRQPSQERVVDAPADVSTDSVADASTDKEEGASTEKEEGASAAKDEDASTEKEEEASVVDTSFDTAPPSEIEDDDGSEFELGRRVSTDEPHTPPDQTDGTKPLRYSLQSLTLDAISSSGSEATKRMSTTTVIEN